MTPQLSSFLFFFVHVDHFPITADVSLFGRSYSRTLNEISLNSGFDDSVVKAAFDAFELVTVRGLLF